MRKLRVYVIGKRTLERTLAFAKGIILSDKTWDTKVVPLKDFLSNGFPDDLNKGDAIATWGILRGTGLLLNEAKKREIDYFFMDHGYFKSFDENEIWYRIVKNDHSCTSLKFVNKKRWETFFSKSNKILPWKNHSECGPNILVCPPTNAVMWYQKINYDWTDYIVKKLKEILPKNKHKNIKIRLKPNEPIVDSRGNLIRLEPNKTDISLEDDLHNSYCVIAYNSNIALQATLKGIPVITSEISPCKAISYKIEDLNKKENDLIKPFCQEPPNRKNLLYWLANNQWNLKEIEKGTAWKMLLQNETKDVI